MNDRTVMPVWMFGVFIVLMNTTMFNVSIPGIIETFHITADMGSWIISSYSIGYALSTVIYSRLSDSLPLRRLLLVGLTILGLSSAIGIFAHDFNTLLAVRILQSAGAGTMSGLGIVMASRYIPYERRGRAITMISTGSAMAFGFGPIIGGAITEYVGFNGLFAVTCLILLVLPVLMRLLPKEEPRPIRFDALGAILTVVNAGTLLIAVMQRSLLWSIGSLLSFAVHAWYLRTVKNETFINPALFAKRDYRKLTAVGFCVLVLNMGNLFLMPLALANLAGESTMTIGLTIAPGAILSALSGRFVGRWIDRYGNIRFLLIGHVVLASVLAIFSFAVEVSPLVVLCGYLFFSPSFSATLSSLNNETSRILPKQMIGSGMGLMQLIQFFGGSISVAVCGMILTLQKNSPLGLAYENVYRTLLAVCLLSLAVALWYTRTAGRAEVQPG
ncbi:MFS transporter [Paenibacillus sacheonensis]|uniref:MFS transporter n=1 Tax=Paenibacillus sacheonensis TaxID=742054 RepID=A0A7X4YQX7_9BACL|nr:MFS transporter [Paenibacillus sacheonensis]MBM7567186.1 DHA2 family metal-tetracycline-proton antiporter-like MFS transporter [Paenibacillus sacheonensis]NBC70888.1 MFS transporter [Paenibacillus sacheonensis]